MESNLIASPFFSVIDTINTDHFSKVHYQLSPTELTKQTLDRREGILNNTGALLINTGEFTGRSPKDKFIVNDDITRDTVNWNDFNLAIEPIHFDNMYQKMITYLSGKEVWVRDCFACAASDFRIRIRVINENPWSNLFAHNMFIRPTETDLEHFNPEWNIIQAPGFKANPATDGTRQHNFAMVSFSKKTILIGGVCPRL